MREKVKMQEEFCWTAKQVVYVARASVYIWLCHSLGCLLPQLQPVQEAIESGCATYERALKSYNPAHSLWAPSVIESGDTAGQGVTTLPRTLVKETDEHHSKLRRTHFGLTNSGGIMELLSCAAVWRKQQRRTYQMYSDMGEQCAGMCLFWLIALIAPFTFPLGGMKNRKLDIFKIFQNCIFFFFLLVRNSLTYLGLFFCFPWSLMK